MQDFVKSIDITRMGRSHLLLTNVLCKVHIYVPGLVPTGFTDLRISFVILLAPTRLLKMMSKRLSWLTTNFRKASLFKATFSNII